MNHSRGIPLYVNPAIGPALDALSRWLEDNHYPPRALERVVAYAARERTPTGSPCLKTEHEAGASGAFLRNLPAVPHDSPAWDDESVILDARMLADGVHPRPPVGEFNALRTA